jgi:hypothetical protein
MKKSSGNRLIYINTPVSYANEANDVVQRENILK